MGVSPSQATRPRRFVRLARIKPTRHGSFQNMTEHIGKASFADGLDCFPKVDGPINAGVLGRGTRYGTENCIRTPIAKLLHLSCNEINQHVSTIGPRSMKRNFGRAASALLLANGFVALSGCGGSEEAAPVASPASVGAEVVPLPEGESAVLGIGLTPTPPPPAPRPPPPPPPRPHRRHRPRRRHLRFRRRLQRHRRRLPTRQPCHGPCRCLTLTARRLRM